MVMMTIVQWNFMEFGVANIQTVSHVSCNVWNQGGSSRPDLAQKYGWNPGCCCARKHARYLVYNDNKMLFSVSQKLYFELCITMYLHDPIHSHVSWQTVFSFGFTLHKLLKTHFSLTCFDSSRATCFVDQNSGWLPDKATGHKCCEGGWSGVETSRGDLGALAGPSVTAPEHYCTAVGV